MNREQPPASGPIRPFHIPPVSVERLPNGLELRAIQRSSVPLVSVALVLDAGETAAPEGEEGVAVLTGDALLGGTADLPAGRLAEALDALGSGLAVSTGWDSTTVSFTCVAERTGEMLGLASRVIREPVFPDGEVDRIRNQQVAGIRQGRMQPNRLAADTLNAAVFDATEPYHRPQAGTEQSVSRLTRTHAEAYRAARFAPASAGLAVVGDLSAAQVLSLAEEGLGSWSGTAIPPTLTEESTRTRRRVIVVDRPGAVQSEIRVGHAGPPRGHPDEVALRVTNTILGGAFTSRLNMSLREKHGYTYGVRSSFAFFKRRGRFSVGTAVQTEMTAPALEEMIGVVSRFVAQGPTEDELPRARDYLAGVLPLRMETTSQLASRLAGTMIFGLPADYYQTYRERIRAVRMDDAVRAVQAHVFPDDLSVVVVGDAETVTADIARLELGDVEVMKP